MAFKESKTTTSTTEKESAPVRRERIPLGQQKNRLGIRLKEELRRDFDGAWIKDSNEGGTEIQRHLLAGYEFARPQDVETIGVDLTFDSTDQGSIIRSVANPSIGDGEYLYFMKILKEYKKEDFEEEQKRIDRKEEGVLMGVDASGQKIEGTYGEIKIN